jgi:hypothetical protein
MEVQMKLAHSMQEAEAFVIKWQEILRLRDWDIILYEVTQEWEKTADITIDQDDKRAVLMLNGVNPKETSLEAVIVHELIHLKLWGMDQMTEQLIRLLFGENEADPKYAFAITRHMELLESTVEDLAKSFITLGGDSKELLFGRVTRTVKEKLSKEIKPI